MRRWRKRSMAETNPWQRDKPLFNPPPRRQMLGNPRKKKPAAGEKPLPALVQVNVRRKKPRIDRHGKSGSFPKGGECDRRIGFSCVPVARLGSRYYIPDSRRRRLIYGLLQNRGGALQ